MPALRYAGGVLVAADTLAAYGSLARFEGVSRMKAVGVAEDTLLAAGGDISDYQQMLKMIDTASIEEYAIDDGASMSASALHQWLTRVMYNRRSKMDPLWNRCAAARALRAACHSRARCALASEGAPAVAEGRREASRALAVPGGALLPCRPTSAPPVAASAPSVAASTRPALVTPPPLTRSPTPPP